METFGFSKRLQLDPLFQNVGIYSQSPKLLPTLKLKTEPRLPFWNLNFIDVFKSKSFLPRLPIKLQPPRLIQPYFQKNFPGIQTLSSPDHASKKRLPGKNINHAPKWTRLGLIVPLEERGESNPLAAILVGAGGLLTALTVMTASN